MLRIVEADGAVLVRIGGSVKIVRPTWLEVLGRAVLAGATAEVITQLEADHRAARAVDPLKPAA
jgi:hypothetical protein